MKGQRHGRRVGARFKFTNVNLYFAAHGERRKLKLDKPKTLHLPPSREKREIIQHLPSLDWIENLAAKPPRKQQCGFEILVVVSLPVFGSTKYVSLTNFIIF